MSDALSFEQAMEKLEVIVKQLESDAISLEESLGLFEEGVHLGRFCSEKLDEADHKIQVLLETPDGELVTEHVDNAGD